MRIAHTVAEVRAAEELVLERTPGGALMARASAGLAAAVADLLDGLYGRRVLLLVGAGNNGGDALVAGSMLARRGARVWALPMSAQVHEEGLNGLLRARGRVVDLGEVADEVAAGRGFDVVIDGIVGIGGQGGLRSDAIEALAVLTGIPMVSVDVPSGVEVDSGEAAQPHVQADLTVTFGTHKVAHLVDPAAAACGAVHLVDLGLDLPGALVESLQAADVAALLPVPSPQAHKYVRGVVGVRAGSTMYPGAALLCVAGAASGLAGMVRYVGPGEVADQVRRRFPEVVGAGRVQAWCVGSGGDDLAARALATSLSEAVSQGCAVVVDADALAHLPADLSSDVAGRLVLTPHAGELAKMLGLTRDEIEAAPLRYVRAAARRWGCVVLLKGRRTLVADPTGRVRSNATGTPWLATAGAGDVLTGVIGSLLAAGLEPFDAASAGAWVHGAAASLASAGGPLQASDVACAVPAAVRSLQEASGTIAP